MQCTNNDVLSKGSNETKAKVAASTPHITPEDAILNEEWRSMAEKAASELRSGASLKLWMSLSVIDSMSDSEKVAAWSLVRRSIDMYLSCESSDEVHKVYEERKMIIGWFNTINALIAATAFERVGNRRMANIIRHDYL